MQFMSCTHVCGMCRRSPNAQRAEQLPLYHDGANFQFHEPREYGIPMNNPAVDVLPVELIQSGNKKGQQVAKVRITGPIEIHSNDLTLGPRFEDGSPYLDAHR